MTLPLKKCIVPSALPRYTPVGDCQGPRHASCFSRGRPRGGGPAGCVARTAGGVGPSLPLSCNTVVPWQGGGRRGGVGRSADAEGRGQGEVRLRCPL